MTKAEPHLRQAADLSPDVQLVFARLYFKQGKADDGRREAATLCKSLGPLVGRWECRHQVVGFLPMRVPRRIGQLSTGHSALLDRLQAG